MKIIGICGYSGSGKTTLLKKLIPMLKSYGIRLAVIKHSHHDMDIDIPGKDSYELRRSGSEQVIVTNDNRWALVTETPLKPAKLADLICKFEDVDLVLVEGFKEEEMAKIICYRKDVQKPFVVDDYTVAIATDTQLNTSVQQFNIDSVQEIALFIKYYLLNC